MNNKVPISSSVFERLELSIQKNLSAIQMVWAICSSQPFQQLKLSIQKICQPFEQLELSVQKKLSAFGTVRADQFRKICQQFQLFVGKTEQ